MISIRELEEWLHIQKLAQLPGRDDYVAIDEGGLCLCIVPGDASQDDLERLNSGAYTENDEFFDIGGVPEQVDERLTQHNNNSNSTAHSQTVRCPKCRCDGILHEYSSDGPLPTKTSAGYILHKNPSRSCMITRVQMNKIRYFSGHTDDNT